MQWNYADKYHELPSGQAEQVEALVAIAEQLEQLNKHLTKIEQKIGTVKVSGGVNTHAY